MFVTWLPSAPVHGRGGSWAGPPLVPGLTAVSQACDTEFESHLCDFQLVPLGKFLSFPGLYFSYLRNGNNLTVYFPGWSRMFIVFAQVMW